MRKSLFWSRAIAIAAIGVLAANAQAQRGPADPQMRGDGPPPEARPFSITRADPALDQIISPDARLVELAHGFGLTEAGLWIADGQSGSWIFGGLLDNVLYRVNPQGQVSVFMEKAGYSGNDPDHVGTQTRAGRSHVLLIGPSCTGMDHEGRVIWCADDDREVMRLEKDGAHTVLSSGTNGQKFSGPNDIAIAADDAVYVADNDFGLRDAGKNPDKQLQNGIYRIKDGKTTLVLSGADLGGTPNGIALSPDGAMLYVGSDTQAKVWKLPVDAAGAVGAPTLLIDGPQVPGGFKVPDGICVDDRGDLYVANNDDAVKAIVVFDPAGHSLGRIPFPLRPSNCSFGGADRRTLYVTTLHAVYALTVPTPGLP